jgi:hypothetical protein
MKKEEGKKIEVIIKNKRHFLSERIAKIAINHFGGIEVVPLATPKEVLTKTLPPSVKPVLLIEPPEVKVFKPDVKVRKPRKK